MAKFCPECGAAAEGAKFCPECGAALGEQAAPTFEPVTTAPAVEEEEEREVWTGKPDSALAPLARGRSATRSRRNGSRSIRGCSARSRNRSTYGASKT
jgi:hypothetical protein